MTDWLPGLVLPNMILRDPIEAGIAAFVAWDDPRLIAACKKDKSFNSFLTRFTDAFGVKLHRRHPARFVLGCHCRVYLELLPVRDFED
jgi:hypothetical protein